LHKLLWNIFSNHFNTYSFKEILVQQLYIWTDWYFRCIVSLPCI